MSEPMTAYVGMPVQWWAYSNTGERPFAGFVTAVSRDVVSLAVLQRNSYSLRLVDGARHRDDPLGYRQEVREYGVWDYTPEHKEAAAFRGRVAALEAQVAKLAESLGVEVASV